MPVKKGLGECFGKVIRSIDRCIHPFEMDKVTFDPFTECKVFNINVSSAIRWFLCIPHCSTAVIILVRYRSCFLWYIQIP